MAGIYAADGSLNVSLTGGNGNGSIGSSTNPSYSKASGITKSSALTAFPANTPTKFINANSARLFFRAQNRATAPIIVGYDNTVSSGNGFIIDPGATINNQGGAIEDYPAHTGEYWIWSSVAGSVYSEEGI